VHAEIKDISSFNEMHATFRALDKHSLVVFDVDKVLLMPEDAIGHPLAKPFRKMLKKTIEEKGSRSVKKHLSQFLLQAKQGPVEKELLQMIRELQKRQVKVMVCTAKGRGSYGDIPRVDKHRFQQLTRAGYCFKKAFPGYSPMEVPTKKGNRLFRKGVLFAGGAPKGKVLRTFLKKVGFRPKRVIFFDDKMKNVKSVNKAMKKWGVEVTAVRYQGAEKRAVKFDEKAIEKQCRHFVKHGTWLNDQKVK